MSPIACSPIDQATTGGAGQTPAPGRTPRRRNTSGLRRKPWTGLAAGTAILAVLAAAVISTSTGAAPASAATTGGLVLADVPTGVRSVDVSTNWGYLGCHAVTSDAQTATNWGVAPGDVVLASWHTDTSCASAATGTSRATVPSNLSGDFLFQLNSSRTS